MLIETRDKQTNSPSADDDECVLCFVADESASVSIPSSLFVAHLGHSN